MGDRRRRLIVATLIVLTIVLVSTVAYFLIGGGDWSLADCFYMTLVTLSTVGFQEVLPVGDYEGARAFTMALLVVGIASVGYFLSTLTAFLIEGDLQEILGKRKMERRITKMSGHIILLGVGHTGQFTALQLRGGGHPVVLVDLNEDAIQRALSELGEEIPYLVADGSEEKTLLSAGVERARGVICAMDSDQANLYAVVSARQINPKLRIVAKASTVGAANKLQIVGADRTVAPAQLGGLRLFAEMVRPEATTFLETLLMDHGRGVRVQEVTIGESSLLAGQTLAEANLRGRVGDVLVLAHRRAGEDYFSPALPDSRLTAGATLIVMGDGEALRRMCELT